MIHQDIKGLTQECDEVISKFMSLNIPITDTKGEHSLMVFILVRKGYTLEAQSPARSIKSCSIRLDDAFHMDELLQDLNTKCEDAIRSTPRYEVDNQ